jgi:predicted dehydrogenase
MALTLEQVERIVNAVERASVPFTMAWQMRVDPQNREMKRLLHDGTFGKIFMVRRRHGLSTHVWPNFEQTWHVKPALNRGMWADDAAHAIDFLLWLLGKPQSVMAEIDTLHNPKVPDDNGIAVFKYASGTIAEVCGSFTCLAGENTTEIVCANGVILQNFGDGPSTQINRAKDAPGLKWMFKGDSEWRVSDIPSPKSHGERIAALAPELAKFLRGQRDPIATAHQGRDALHMTLACYDSSSTGQRVLIKDN